MEYVIAKLLEDFEDGKMNRRQLIQSLALAASAATSAIAVPPPAKALQAPTKGSNVFKVVEIEHISYHVKDYARTRDFYAGLFGMQVSRDDGASCRLKVGNTMLTPRSVVSHPEGKVGIEHIAFKIANWDTDKSIQPAFEAEMKRRGLTTNAPSWHPQTGPKPPYFTDPDGLGVEVMGER